MNAQEAFDIAQKAKKNVSNLLYEELIKEIAILARNGFFAHIFVPKYFNSIVLEKLKKNGFEAIKNDNGYEISWRQPKLKRLPDSAYKD